MPDLPFPILGTTIPPLIGRAGIMQSLWIDLTKTSPSHLSVVGPRFVGKTVLMHGLAERMRRKDSPYGAVILWDLGHQIPDSNDAFLKALCRKLGEGLKAIGNEYGDHLLAVETDEYGDLREVIDAMNDDGFKVLMLWDGFDKPLSSGKLTRNLWDQLRELASNPSLRLVTATRLTLHELIRNEESVTSDFWNIFDMNPVRLGVFDESDRDAIMAIVEGASFMEGARSELMNWTAGYPPFYLAVLNSIVAAGATGKIDNNVVNGAAEAALEGVGSILQYLWDDCREPEKDLYRRLMEHGELSAVELGNSEKRKLEEKGFIKKSGSRIAKGCRLLERYIISLGEDTSSLVRSFGDWEKYRGNIRRLLELRLGQIDFKDRLSRYVEFSINHLPDDPELSLNYLTSIEERALDIIWQREFGIDRVIPHEVVRYWTAVPRSQNKFIKGMMDENHFVVLPDRGRQLGLLQLLTGSTQGFDSKTKATSKDTYVLLNAIHSFRNRNQHSDGQEVNIGVAVAAIMTCLELLACLDREMKSE